MVVSSFEIYAHYTCCARCTKTGIRELVQKTARRKVALHDFGKRPHFCGLFPPFYARFKLIGQHRPSPLICGAFSSSINL